MAKSAEEIEQAWLERWWKADWSWEGLAGKPVGEAFNRVHGGPHGERDLQGYWRRDPVTGAFRDDTAMQEAGELVSAYDGALWHLAHVPLYWRNGTAAKVLWPTDLRQRLREVVARRVAPAGATTMRVSTAEGPDRRAQLSGAVLLDPPSAGQTILNIRCDQANLPAWVAREVQFGTGFQADGALFRDQVDFVRARFRGDASFRHAIFTHGILLSGAHFVSDISPDRASFDSSFADFTGATFVDRAAFAQIHFGGATGFSSAVFLAGVSFYKTKFEGDVRFTDSTVSGNAGFQCSVFASRADFAGTRFAANAAFDAATFGQGADFMGGEFGAQASFTGTKFFDAEYDDLSVPFANFAGRRFRDFALFTQAEFRRRINFQATVFERLARFDGVVFPASADLWEGMFSQTQFRDVGSFHGAGGRHFAAFDGAIFGGGLQLDSLDETRSRAWFRTELNAATHPALPPSPPASKTVIVYLAPILEVPPETGREAALKSLERGCRVLKQAMEKSSDKSREQMFYAFELTARRHQRDTPAWERFFSRAYALTGDYGRSIARPLLFLLATIPLFALFYWLLLPTAQDGWPRIYHSLTLSLGRVFPFGLWQVTGDAFQQNVLGLGNTAISLAIRGLATLQSLLAIIFAFLAGLALRRRFQIS